VSLLLVCSAPPPTPLCTPGASLVAHMALGQCQLWVWRGSGQPPLVALPSQVPIKQQLHGPSGAALSDLVLAVTSWGVELGWGRRGAHRITHPGAGLGEPQARSPAAS
jgi:hypothetical protein